VERELDRRDDAERAAAPAHGPEQVALVRGVRPHLPPVGEHELDRRHGVAA
jgi:hypothetical protein